MKQFTHISFYKFVPIEDTQALQKQILELAQKHDLKGTVLLAPEGLNSMLAGSRQGIDAFIADLQKDPRFENILFKFNEADTQPFNKLLVKVKKEILTFKADVDPNQMTGKYLKPVQLKEWLKNGEEIVLLDTRNDFEVQEGTFKGAINPKIGKFTEFKDAVSQLSHLKNKRIVTFCTGGIRCEKATAYMIQQGFQDVYQIEGGILQYLKDTGGDFWEGNCFVFDYRWSVDKDLHEVPTKAQS